MHALHNMAFIPIHLLRRELQRRADAMAALEAKVERLETDLEAEGTKLTRKTEKLKRAAAVSASSELLSVSKHTWCHTPCIA